MTKHIGVVFGFVVTLLALTACSMDFTPNFLSNNNAENQPQQSASATPASAGDGLPSSPIVAPPSFNNRPAEPGQSTAQETLPNGLPALKPLKGFNVDSLFAENINNTDRRFQRVENAVLDLRREFEVMKPAIVRLVAIESDIQNLVQQLETMITQDPLRNAAQPAPAAVPAQVQPSVVAEAQNAPTSLVPSDTTATPAQPARAGPNASAKPKVADAQPPPSRPPDPGGSVGGISVQNLRTGIYPDKVRLVLDLSRKTSFSVDLDAAENFLLIELPEARWQGPTSKTFSSKDPLLSSYNVERINGDKGSRIIVTLKKSTRILKQQALPPNTTPFHRVFVDLAK